MSRLSNTDHVDLSFNGFGNRITDSNLSQSSRSKRLNGSLDPALNRARSLRHNHEKSLEDEDMFAKTASKLQEASFIHHDNKNCLCSECKCGRHYCKLKVVKPNLTKKTVYQHSFYKQQAVPNDVNHHKQYDRFKAPHLEINSVYRIGFPGLPGDKIQRPHPQDLLHSSVPAPQLTSYSSQFPGYRGENQYVKPTNKHSRGSIAFRSKSTYSNTFVKKQAKKDDYEYFKGQLKTGYNWLGRTTYSNFFSNPNPEYMAKKVKVVEQKEDNPNFEHQFQTIYKNDFVKKENSLCPSKIYLQTKVKGSFNDFKHNFIENADFKGLSRNYHLASTSRHSYV